MNTTTSNAIAEKVLYTLATGGDEIASTGVNEAYIAGAEMSGSVDRLETKHNSDSRDKLEGDIVRLRLKEQPPDWLAASC